MLPFLFARLDQPFRSSILLMLAGTALCFAAVGILTAVGATWMVRANQGGRLVSRC